MNDAIDALIMECSWFAWLLLAVPPERRTLDFWRINGALGSDIAHIREAAD
jgi:hypothetical protein